MEEAVVRPGRGFYARWGCVFAALGLVLLAPVLNGGFFADDWELYLAEPAKHIARAFVELRPYGLYRPIQLLLVATSQALFGYTTIPVHLLNLAVHVSLALVVMRALFAAGAPSLAAALAGVYLTVSQLAASAVGGNDTISLTLGTLAGTGALLLMDPLATGSFRPVSALVFAALSLLAKESSLGYLPLLCLLALRPAPGRRAGVRLALGAGFAALGLGYLALRKSLGAAGPDFGSPGGMRLGSNLVVNAAQLAVASVVPVQTSRIYLGAIQHRWLWPAAGALSTLALIGFVLRGLARAGRLAMATVCIGAVGAVLVPVLPLPHISELYAYAALPFVAALFGWGAAELISRSATPAGRHAAAAFAALVLLSNAWATRDDAAGMARSGELAAVLMPQVLDAVRALPPGGILVLVDPPVESPSYSVFHVGGLRGVQLSTRGCLEMAGRGDVKVRNVYAGDPLPGSCPGCVFRTLAGGARIVPFDPAPGSPAGGR